jgi:DMSO reductase anchor subunit
MKGPQTLPGVIGFILFAITVWVAGPVVIGSRPFEWWRAAEGMLTGALFAIAMTAMDHSRLPVDKRLAPAHAIGLGGFSLALLGMMVAEGAARRTELDAIMVVGALLFALPGCYLILAGLRQRKAEAKADG